MALEPRNKIRQSDPLEGEDARRFVEEIDRGEGSEKQREFLRKSKGMFRRVFSPRPANDLLARDSK
jgi:hypothetical protein